MSCSPDCLAFMEKCYAEEAEKTQVDYKALYEAQLEENEKLKEGTLLKFQEVEIEDLKEENKKLKDFSNWENHPALKHKVVLDDDYYLAHLHEGELIEPEDYKELEKENQTFLKTTLKVLYEDLDCALRSGDLSHLYSNLRYERLNADIIEDLTKFFKYYAEKLQDCETYWFELKELKEKIESEEEDDK